MNNENIAITDKQKEATMILTNNLKVGDTIWYISDNLPIHIKCDSCDGSGKIDVVSNGVLKKARCPDECINGTIYTYQQRKVKDTIKYITIYYMIDEESGGEFVATFIIPHKRLRRDYREGLGLSEIYTSEDEINKKYKEIYNSYSNVLKQAISTQKEDKE